MPFATWAASIGAGSVRCADGGSVVAVVERTPPLDCAPWAPECGVADAVHLHPTGALEAASERGHLLMDHTVRQ